MTPEVAPARDYRPSTAKMEWHITYKCDLTCVACSRASFLRRPHTPDMAIGDARKAMADCDALGWQPAVIIIGGEPTVHPDFLNFVRIAREWMRAQGRVGQHSEVHVYSNGTSARARELCDRARLEWDASIIKTEWKPEGSRVGGEPDQPAWHKGMFVSPEDAGLPWQGPCYCHSSQICGVGVDSWGYAACPTALSVGALLPQLQCRTKVLADLFDPVKVSKMTVEMCRHCGYYVQGRGGRPEDHERFARYVEAQAHRNGTPMSPTWLTAFKRRAWPGPRGEKNGTLDRARLPMAD